MQEKFDKHNLTLKEVGKQTGLHTSSLSGYVRGEYLPRLINLVAIVEIISIADKTSPRELLHQALLSLDELTYAEERFNKRNNKD